MVGFCELRLVVVHFGCTKLSTSKAQKLVKGCVSFQPLVTHFPNKKREIMRGGTEKGYVLCRWLGEIVAFMFQAQGEAFFLAYSGLCMRPAETKRKKHTEHEKVQFLGTTEHERGPYTHATRQNTH